MTKIQSFLSFFAAAALAACGAPQKPVDGGLPGPKGNGAAPAGSSDVLKTEPKREISRDARKDYAAAASYYAEQEKDGWRGSSCEAAADRFQAVANEYTDLAEAQYMVGRSWHNCNDLGKAEAAYQKALRMKANHAQSMSNLGEIYYRAGKVAEARRSWESAIKANPKLEAAYNNLASMLLEQLRANKGDWAATEKQARDYLSSVLAVDNDNIQAYVLYGLVYMEGRQKNKNRLDLAKLLLDEGAKRKENYAPLHNAYGRYHLFRNNLREALKSFSRAVELDGNFAEARMNVGLITLGFRKYDSAKEQFSKVIELQPKNYDALIGLGIAQRGLGDLDGAEESYKKAKGADPSRGDAYFNIGVLYKDFRASKQTDLKQSIANYETAKGFFKDFLGRDGSADDKAEAKDNITDCEKVVKQLEQVIKMQAQQPSSQAPVPPAPAAEETPSS